MIHMLVLSGMIRVLVHRHNCGQTEAWVYTCMCALMAWLAYAPIRSAYDARTHTRTCALAHSHVHTSRDAHGDI